MSFGGKPATQSFNTYTPPDYTALKDLLYGYQSKGFPEIMSENYWGEPWRQTGQNINEMFQAKRGMNLGTPEYTQLQNARAGLMSNLIGQNVGVRQNALTMLANITPRPQTQSIETPQQPSVWENMLQFGAPLASAGVSNYMGNQQMNQLANLLGGGTRNIQPKSPSDIYDLNAEPDWKKYATLASTAAKFNPYTAPFAAAYDVGSQFF